MNLENEVDEQPTWIDEQRLKFDRNFDTQFFVGLEALMGSKPNIKERLIITDRLFEAVQAYKSDQLELDDFKNEKEENEALEKVSKKANQLYDAIMDLHEFGRTESKLTSLLASWLPDGREIGGEWVALNPTRNDRRAGSFKINVKTGIWADFATGDGGGDPISLYAYLNGLKQIEAARALRYQLGGAA